VIDFAVLGAMITRADRIDEKVTRRDRTYLNNMVGELQTSRSLWVAIDGAERGIDVLTQILARADHVIAPEPGVGNDP
jgi:hypothetical protein